MSDLAAGLIARKRAVGTVHVWDVVHDDSGLPVVRDCRTRTEAAEVADALARHADWAGTAEQLEVDPRARRAALRLQSAVWAPRVRKARA